MNDRGLILTYPVRIIDDDAILTLARLPPGSLPNIPPYNGRTEYVSGSGARFANDVVALPDPAEMRRGILYWDVVWRPELRAIPGITTPEEKFLIECGVYSTAPAPWELPDEWPRLPQYLIETYRSCFDREEINDPGVWAISHGLGGLSIEPSASLERGRGVLVKLYRAIPVPSADVPLEDILNFKEKRKDELKALNLEIGRLFSQVINSSDSEFEFRQAVSEIDKKCSDVIKAGKESQIEFSLSDMTYDFSLELNTINLLAGSALGGLLGSTIEMSAVGVALGAGTALFKLNMGFGGNLGRSKAKKELALSPYRVTSRIISEPI